MMLLGRRLPRFYGRLDHLSKIIATVDATTDKTSEQIFSAEKAIMQIQIEWELFVRNLILDSATGNFKNGSGPIVSRRYSDLRSREAAAYRLISTYNRQRFEPDWYLPDKAIDASIRLDISNQPQIAAELGVTPWPIDELRHIRNFIAHKSKRAALTVRQTGITGTSAKIDVLDVALQYSTGGAKRYIGWISFSKGVAARLVV